jgi:putative redox protein
MTASIVYEGKLRCSATHVQSGTIVETDAPTDNKGKGERFSPTDTICMGFATCIVTTMAIKAVDMDIELQGTHIEVTKHMASDPRRIAAIDVTLRFPALKLEEKDRVILQRTGDTCPVARSLHPDVKQNVQYIWG